MSIKVMTHVWEHSKQGGSDLLLLLAIADFCHDDGKGAYPSIATLAKKCRMSIRNTQYVIRKLADSGELIIKTGEGTNHSNLYEIPLLSVTGVQPASGVQSLQGCKTGY